MLRPLLADLPRTNVNGTSLAFWESGQGNPLVLVHGGVSDLRTWDHQVPTFSKQYRVVYYSRRYAQPNEEIPDGLDDSMLPHVEDLIALMRMLEAVPAHLVGHSWGGFICLLAAIRCPEVVRSLVLMEPPVLSLLVSTPPRPGELLRVFRRWPRTGLAILRFGAGAVAPAQKAFARGDDESGMRAFGHGVLGKSAYSQLSAARLDQIRANLKPDKAQLLGAGFPPLKADEIRRVRVPTLLMHGERSPKLFRYLEDRLEELLPNVVRFEVSDASHIMHEDNPASVNDRIQRFLATAV